MWKRLSLSTKITSVIGYARYGDDLLRTLAARYVSLTEGLHIPPWSAAWYTEQARTHQIDGAVILAPKGGCVGRGDLYFTRKALEEAGVPVFELGSDNVDPRSWSDEEIQTRLSVFLETKVLEQ